MKYKKAHVIINPASGRDRPMLYALNQVFQEFKMDWDVSITKKDGDACEFAKKLKDSDVDVVVSYGGDGTIMQVVNGLMGSQKPLLTLRGGSGNVIANELGIPFDLEESLRLLKEGKERAVDVGVMEDQYFLLRVSFGFEANVVKETDRETKKVLGSLAYAMGAFKTLIGTTSGQYHIQVDDESLDIEGLCCIVANSGNIGLPGLSLAPDIEIDDGLLDVIVIRYPNLNDLFQSTSFVIDQRKEASSFIHLKGKKIKIEVSPCQNIQCDGEILKAERLSFEVRPKAIRLIVPK